MMKWLSALGIICLVFQINAFAQYEFAVDSSIIIRHDSLQIGASLYLPKSGKKVPGMVMVSGTNPQDRNGTMAGFAFFKQIATHLAEHGFAVLLMDDRGVGKSTGKYQYATTADFANDALEGLSYLKRNPNIQPKKIGLIGHSEGGAAIAIAASKSKDVKFIVSLAGLASDGLASLIQQNQDIVNNSTLPQLDKDRSNTINRLMFETAFSFADSPKMADQLNKTYDNWKRVDDSLFKLSGVKFDHFRFPIYSYVRQATGKWYRYFVRYNAQEVLRKITVPVLAINGEQDLMVNPKVNLANWKNFITAGGNKKVTTILIPKVNHLLQSCETCKPDEYTKIKTGVSTVILNEMTSWLQQISK